MTSVWMAIDAMPVDLLVASVLAVSWLVTEVLGE